MFTRALILPLILIFFSISTSYSETTDPLRITIYPSRIADLGLGSNKIIISKKQIQETTAKNLPELLSQQTGIQSISLYGGIDNTKAAIGIGGFGEQAGMNTAIFLNGVRINNVSMASVNFGNIPLQNIQKIEIIKGGGASVLFGDGAVAGAINIITNKNIYNKKTITLDQKVMSYNGRKTNIYTSQNFKNFSVQLNHNYTRSDQYRDNNDYKLDSSSVNLSSLDDNGVYTYLKFKKFDEDIRLPGGISRDDYFSNPKQTKESYAFAREELSSVEIGYNRLYLGDIKTSGSISYSDKIATSYFDYFRYYNHHNYDSSNQYNYGSLQGYQKGQLKDVLFGKPTFFNFGLDFYNSDYSDKVLVGTYYKRTAEQLTFDPWLIGQMSLDNDFALEVGIRHHFYELDVYNKTNAKQKLHNKSSDTNAWSFGGTKKIDDKNTLNFKLSKSFRSPKVDEVLHYGGVISEVEHQNSKMFELGHKFNFDNVIFKTNVFKSEINNLIYYNGSVNDNYNPTVHEGYDIDTHIEYNDFLFNLNVSHVISEFNTGSNKGKQLPMVANWTSNASITYLYNNELKLLLSNQFVGNRYRIGDESNTNEKAKSYNLYNTAVNYKLNDLDISFNINNIFDKKYYHYETSGWVYPLSELNWSLEFKYPF